MTTLKNRQIAFNAPEGFLINGKIVPSVASNNLTVAIKGMDGNDPSASNPIYIRIGDTIRAITAALSVTKNAGTNWCNSGSSELATKETDYFVYIGYNATDGVVLGFARKPNGERYNDFSTTNTDASYCAISDISNAAATDYYVVIGRFGATLSATANFYWSVPTFTGTNLIQHPIFNTRWLTWQPAYSCSGSMTISSVSTLNAKYSIHYNSVLFQVSFYGTTGGTAGTQLHATPPYTMYQQGNSIEVFIGSARDGAGYLGGFASADAGELYLSLVTAVNWGLGAVRGGIIGGTYEI